MVMVRNQTRTIHRETKGLQSPVQAPEKKTWIVFRIACFAWTALTFNYLSNTLISLNINSSSPIQ